MRQGEKSVGGWLMVHVHMVDTTLETMSKTQKKKLEKQQALEAVGARDEEGNRDVDMAVE